MCWIVALLLLFLHVAAGESFFEKGKNPITLPVNIKVVLVGFDGTGAYSALINASELHDVLEKQLKVHQPLIRGKEKNFNNLNVNGNGNENAGIKYIINYEVIHYRADILFELEAILKTNMVNANKMINGKAAFDVDVDRIIPFFELLIGKLKDSSTFGSRDEEGSHALKLEYLIFMLNPEKSRMIPADFDTMHYNYRYKLGNGGGRGTTWVGTSNFCVIDISAGPVVYGELPDQNFISQPFLNKDHTIFTNYRTARIFSTLSLPSFLRLMKESNGKMSFEEVFSINDHMFYSDCVKVIQSAITQIFFPNIGFETNLRADKIIIPIIVLRNHDQFHPFNKLSNSNNSRFGEQEIEDFQIDMKIIEAQLQRMLLPKQKIVLTKGVHFLHDHPRISLALQKSILQIFAPNEEFRPYIDSEMLIHELGHSDDLLAAALFGLSHDSDEFIIPSKTVSQVEKEFEKMEALGTEADPSIVEDLKQKIIISRKQGTRILPIYVFSLLGKHKELLFDGEELVKGTKNAILVLQTGESEIPTPYFQDEHTNVIKLNGRSVTNHIIKGLAVALGGIESPLIRAYSLSNNHDYDYTWAIGYHPFGPFSSSWMSTSITSLVIRNHIISRIHVAFDLIEEANSMIDQFFSDYLKAPKDSLLDQYLKSPSLFESLDRISRKVRVLLNHKTAAQDLISGFKGVSNYLENAQFRKSYQQSAIVLTTAMKFRNFVEQEINAFKADLTCCDEYRRSLQQGGDNKQGLSQNGSNLGGHNNQYKFVFVTPLDADNNAPLITWNMVIHMIQFVMIGGAVWLAFMRK